MTTSRISSLGDLARIDFDAWRRMTEALRDGLAALISPLTRCRRRPDRLPARRACRSPACRNLPRALYPDRPAGHRRADPLSSSNSPGDCRTGRRPAPDNPSSAWYRAALADDGWRRRQSADPCRIARGGALCDEPSAHADAELLSRGPTPRCCAEATATLVQECHARWWCAAAAGRARLGCGDHATCEELTVDVEVVKYGSEVLQDPAVQKFVGTVVGAPAGEASAWLADSIRYKRWKGQLKILGKAQRDASRSWNRTHGDRSDRASYAPRGGLADR